MRVAPRGTGPTAATSRRAFDEGALRPALDGGASRVQNRLMAAAPEIDWATATVEAATLHVELAGDAPRGWQGRFKAVARLLDQAGGRWAAVTVTGGVITVKGLAAGVESDLRHFLESVVQQVNADLDLAAEPEREPSAPERRRTADREMASRFRAFAEPGA